MIRWHADDLEMNRQESYLLVYDLTGHHLERSNIVEFVDSSFGVWLLFHELLVKYYLTCYVVTQTFWNRDLIFVDAEPGGLSSTLART